MPVSFTYWPSGRRKTMTDSTGVTSYGYDQRDRLLTKSSPEGSLTYTYDVAGNRKTVQSDSGAYGVRYDYDALNRLSSVSDQTGGGGTTTYHYDDGGRLSSYDYPNGVSSGFTYDALNRVQSMKIGSALGTASENLVASYGYTFYATGNRHTVAELNGRRVTWSYDKLWRLTNETIAGSSANGSISYVYDNVGNRLSRSSSVSGIANQTQTYDNNDRLLADGWDPNGNTLSTNGSQYSYDSEDRLRSLNSSQAQYLYDGDGQLVSRTASGVTTTYLIDSENPTGYTQIAEERVSGAALKSHVYGLQRISIRQSGGLHYYGYDAHSGVRLVANGDGSVTDTWDYDAFGNVIGRTGSTENAFTYRGEQIDTSLGLQYLRSRWMDPGKGRFWTRDGYEGRASRPGSLNLYAYADVNPVAGFDPQGHETLVDMVSSLGIASTLASLAISSASSLTLAAGRLAAGKLPDAIGFGAFFAAGGSGSSGLGVAPLLGFEQVYYPKLHLAVSYGFGGAEPSFSVGELAQAVHGGCGPVHCEVGAFQAWYWNAEDAHPDPFLLAGQAMAGAFIGYEHALNDPAWAALVGVTSDTSTSMFGVLGGSRQLASYSESKGQMINEIIGLQAAFSAVFDVRTGAVGVGGLAGIVINTGSAALWVNKKYGP